MGKICSRHHSTRGVWTPDSYFPGKWPAYHSSSCWKWSNGWTRIQEALGKEEAMMPETRALLEEFSPHWDMNKVFLCLFLAWFKKDRGLAYGFVVRPHSEGDGPELGLKPRSPIYWTHALIARPFNKRQPLPYTEANTTVHQICILVHKRPYISAQNQQWP